jgi:chromosome segregation ATPase
MDLSSLENVFREHLQADQRRLDRIEEKIDKLSEFVVQLARVEEKIESLEASRDKMGERVGNLETNQLVLKNTLENHERIMSSLTRLFWAVITTAASGLVGAFFFV